jgi:hypothetical protein
MAWCLAKHRDNFTFYFTFLHKEEEKKNKIILNMALIEIHVKTFYSTKILLVNVL